MYLVKEVEASSNIDTILEEDELSDSSGSSTAANSPLKRSPVVPRKAISQMDLSQLSFTPKKLFTETRTKFFAMKILSKNSIIKAKQVDHVFNEMTLQQQIQHPFIVSSLNS